MSKQYDEMWDFMMKGLMKKISEMDILELKDGEVKNVNNRDRNLFGDFGIDNKKQIYNYTGVNWRQI